MNKPTIRRLSDVTKHERVARNIYRTELGKIAMTKDLTTCRKPIWKCILGRGPSGEQMGQVHVRDPHRFGFGVAGAHKIANYIAKYCGKEMQCRALDQKCYFRSRGIVVPEVDVWRVPFCTNMLRAAQFAFQALSGHCMDGLQTRCNNNLGVAYLATAPGLPQVVED